MKKELLVTQSLEKFQQVCSLLKDNNIKYKTKITGQTNTNSSFFSGFFGTSRRARGTFGQNLHLDTFHYIFVDSKNLSEATFIINQK